MKISGRLLAGTLAVAAAAAGAVIVASRSATDAVPFKLLRGAKLVLGPTREDALRVTRIYEIRERFRLVTAKATPELESLGYAANEWNGGTSFAKGDAYVSIRPGKLAAEFEGVDSLVTRTDNDPSWTTVQYTTPK